MKPGFTLNEHTDEKRLGVLRERRDHIHNQLMELLDKLYIINYEIREMEKWHAPSSTTPTAGSAPPKW